MVPSLYSDDPECSDNQDNDEGDEPSLLEVGVECVSDNLGGTFTASFGNDNRTNRELVVVFNPSAGTVNDFSPGTANRRQVTTFQTGRRNGAVPVTFDGAPLAWKVGQRLVACRPLRLHLHPLRVNG